MPITKELLSPRLPASIMARTFANRRENRRTDQVQVQLPAKHRMNEPLPALLTTKHSICRFIMLATSIALLLNLLAAHTADAYNIDLPSYVRHQREPNTMFGFSIALHKARNGYAQYNSLVVGAPKYDTSAYQPAVVEAGAVFKCAMNDNDCTLVKFDATGDHRNTNGDIIERKSHQWLGATVSTGRDNDLVVACAPRYVFHSMTPKKTMRYDPVGTCYASRNFTHFTEISPCRTNNWGYHRQGSCQAGFSAAINSNGSRLYIGAPGSWYWQGQTYSVSPEATFPYKPPYYQPFGTGGQTFSQDVTRPENQVYSTAESSSQDDDSYLGYSMITGDFNGDRVEDVAIGMPRGAGLLGKIVVNRWNMANIFNITGHQIGEYFGYALATSDIDGDGLDDLIIGAPMYSEQGNQDGRYDVGRVYVLLQRGATDAERWTTEFIREGFSSKGRFGLALTTLGDVNRDGFGDFAVGAPYDGPEGRGVVYIFHGSADGPLDKPSQIIHAEDLVEAAPYPRTFGFALAGGVDMDGNTYPDLAVGAYASDQVYVFKSRPVAAVNAETTFASPSKLINLEERSCQTLRDSKRVACTGITTCWSYTGEYLPRNLEFDVSWVLDARKTKNPRMFFLMDEGRNIRNQTISLAYGRTYCHNETVYLSDKVQDKLTPLEVEMRYNLHSQRQLLPVLRRKRDALEPVIDQNREIVLRDAINILKNCGPDNVCEPDLRLKIITVDKYLFGSPEPLTIEVIIANANEDAFEAAFYMVMPKDLDFRKLQQIGDKSDAPITCSVPAESNNYVLKCDIGNPLQGQRVVRFNITMTPSEKFGMSPSYDFFMEANSTNLEKTGSHYDNVYSKSIGIWVDTDLAIEGNSLPATQLYKAADFKAVDNATSEEELGPQVVHIYNIRNNRPSTIEEAIVFVHYPFETIAGDPLMYLTNQPETSGNIVCDPHAAVNVRNLRLDQTLVRKSYLGRGSSISKATGAATTAGHIEKSHAGSSSNGIDANGVPIGRGTTSLSPEEKRRLEKEDEQDVSGDASFEHSRRANAAAAYGAHAASWTSSKDGSGRTQHAENSADLAAPQQYNDGLHQAGLGMGIGAHSTRGHIQVAGHPKSQQQQGQRQRVQTAASGSNMDAYGSAADKSGIYGSHGYRVGTLDLGALGARDNAENELRQTGYSKDLAHAGYGPSYSSQHVQPQPGSYAKPYYGIENDDYYDEDNIQQHQQQQQQQQQRQRSGAYHARHRRAPNGAAQTDSPGDEFNSPCQAAKCQTLRCVVKNLINDEGAWIAIRTRMVAKTLEKIASNTPVNVSTMAIAHVTRLPFIGEPKDAIIKTHEIFFKAEPEPTPVPDVVPLWVVVLAACAGALILLLLIYLLYKCGFFNRNRPTDQSVERQPLRNGYHGDEHL